MSASSPSSGTDVASLINLTTTSSALINHFLTTLSSTAAPTPSTLPSSTIQDPPHPLQVLKDAALLLKSHTTKLSLLLLNKPFTPSAVEGVLRAVTGTCLPAMMSAVELAVPEAWGALLRAEVVARVRRVVRELGVCVEEVKKVAQGEALGRERSAGDGGRDTLTSTGVVWEACDALVELEELDIGGVALIKALQYKALISDALAELKEWGAGEGGGDDDDDDDDEDGGDFADEDAIFGGSARLPKDRPELKAALDDATGKIKKVEILFTALIKRRIRSFTKEQARYKSLVQKIDNLVNDMREIVEATDDIAAAFYELDESQVQSGVRLLVNKATATIRPVKSNWSDATDEFTDWSTKWEEVVK